MIQEEYPTKNQILEAEYLVDPDKIKILTKWKDTTWNSVKGLGNKRAKQEALQILLHKLAIFNDVRVVITPKAETCMYNHSTKTIYLDNSCSIISALHELGHHIYGASELKACVFAINLFKSVFPKSYEKLHWEGHMLKK